MRDPAKAERRKEKRIKQIMLRSMGAAGVGIGLFLLRFLVAPFIGENEEVMQAIVTFSLSLIGLGAVMIVTFLFKKDWLSKVYMAMIWVILPVILVKLLLGVF